MKPDTGDGDDKVALDQRVEVFLVITLMLLLFKFVYPLLSQAMPLGYDVGINRFLFLRYAEAFPLLPDLADWAREHPPLLFYVLAPFIKFGLPVDWVIGWMWNIFAVVLLAVYATVIGRDRGMKIGVVLLLAGFLSTAYFDGFASMYIKNYLGFLWALLTFYLLQKRSLWALATMFLCIMTHHVTALIVCLSSVTWWMIEGWKIRFRSRTWLIGTVSGAMLLMAGVAWYVVSDPDFVSYQLKLLFKQTGESDVYGGAFPPLAYYVRSMPVLLAFGIAGFFMRLRKSAGTVWQLAVLWCLVFIIGRLYFHRRFFLQLDFFLLPFAAHAMYAGITRSKNIVLRSCVYMLLIVQCFFSLMCMSKARPILGKEVLDAITPVGDVLDEGDFVLVPENQSAPFVLGWLPDQRVAAPGLYGFRWSRDEWDDVIFGSSEKRSAVLKKLPAESYMIITPSFFRMYPKDTANALLADPCLAPVQGASLFKITCTSS